MKKTFLIGIFLFILCFPVCIHAQITAWGYCMIDGNTGYVLYKKNADTPHEIASITKIMTAICALENADPNETVVVSAYAASTEGSSCWLEEGEAMSMENMLYGLLLASGNDAAVAIAEHVSGSTASFVELMNETAMRIGEKNSSFKNPHGLDEEGHYSTCYDMAIITKYALTYPMFRTIVGTQYKTIPWQNKQWDRTLHNHNKFLSMYPDVIGVKTGYTDKAGRTLVTAVEKDELLLILVSIQAPDDWNDHKKLYDRAFSEHEMKEIVTDKSIGTLPIIHGKQEFCSYSAQETYSAFMKKGQDDQQFHIKTSLPTEIKAPIQKGDVLGQMHIFCGGELIESRPLIADESVQKTSFFERLTHAFISIIRHIKDFFTT